MKTLTFFSSLEKVSVTLGKVNSISARSTFTEPYWMSLKIRRLSQALTTSWVNINVMIMNCWRGNKCERRKLWENVTSREVLCDVT